MALGALRPPAGPEGAALQGRVLYEQARITDEDLKDPIGASRLYAAYVAAFPRGPYAGLARDRADYIARNGRPPEALAEYEDVLRAFSRGDLGGSLARMETLAEKYPGFPLRARACFWIANVLRQQERYDEAEHWLGVIVQGAPGSRDAHRAELAIAQLESGRDHFAAALAIDRRFLDSPDPLARELARNQLEFTLEARTFRRLFWLGLLVAGGLLVGLAVGIVRRRARLLPLPFELRLYGPIAVLFSLLTVYESRRVGGAVSAIFASGALLLLLNGAYLRAAAVRGLRRWLHLLAAAGAAAGIAYCVVYSTNLTELVVDTIEQGADR